MKRVLIVGGGIGGLSAALALRQTGAQVTLLEKEVEFSPLGAGIILAPNAVAILRRLGVETGNSERLRAMVLGTSSGTTLQRIDLEPWSETLGPALAFQRRELHEALLAALPAEVELRRGTALQSLQVEGEGVVAGFGSGDGGRFDLVVGADGIHSRVRREIGAVGELRYSGDTCWRGVCANPGVDESLELWGNGARIGMVPLRAGRLYVYLVVCAPRRAEAPPWPDGFRALYADFGGPTHEVLGALDGVPLLHHDLDELDAPVWGGGRVWLLGDAAHAMTPNLGQGAAMAIEDALVLARCSAGDPTAGHAQYVAARQARVRKIQLDARRLGQLAHWRSAAAIWARNALFRSVPRRLGDRQYLAVVEPGLALARAA